MRERKRKLSKFARAHVRFHPAAVEDSPSVIRFQLGESSKSAVPRIYRSLTSLKTAETGRGGTSPNELAGR